ncbi:signal peptide peptidase SppA [bacterium]|nr:signal peptide peptidase SppA [bacterium]
MDQNNIPDAPVEKPSRRLIGSSCGCLGLVGALVVCGGLLFLGISFLALSSSIERFVSFFDDSEESREMVSETPSSSLKNKVVKIKVEGAIAFKNESRSLWTRNDDSAENIIDDIKLAREDKDVKGLLLMVDSPGGEITACDMIDQEVKKFRASSSNRYVVAYMRGTAASGGYYVSAHANKIVITPTTITGSIGVMVNGINFAEAAEKLGVKNMTFTSGPMKDMLNPMKGVSPAVSNVVQETISELYDRFVEVIAEGRNMPNEKVRELADGRIYTAKQAVANGLADKVGYMEEVKAAFTELGLPEYELVEYEETERMVDMLKKAFSTFSGFSPQIKLPESSWRFRYASPFMNE